MADQVSERLTIAEAAEYVGLSVSTLRIMRQQGRIPYVQPSPRRIFFERAELERWLEARRVRAS